MKEACAYRVDAAEKLVSLKLFEGKLGAYHKLASLLGYAGITEYVYHLKPHHHRVLDLLAGENGYVVYKALLARKVEA